MSLPADRVAWHVDDSSRSIHAAGRAARAPVPAPLAAAGVALLPVRTVGATLDLDFA